MSTSLMTSRRFAPLFWCQFFSAFNDNFLKNALVFLILFKIGSQDAEALITLAGAVFIAPFFFLSGLGGQLADRFDKAAVARRLKLAEIGVTALADVRKSAGFADKLRGLLAAKTPLVPRNPDDPAVILFTSGSEGAPKGVVLSHRNILANAAQAAARIDFGRTDKVFNVLPVFHSFGLTAGLVLPVVSGVRIYLYPSPLHYRTVPELIYGVNATILFGTDSFLAGYARAAHSYDFRAMCSRVPSR